MHTFDSSRVAVELSPRDIEALFDDYCCNSPRLSRSDAAPVVLAYADHTRVCALLAGAVERFACAWHPVFAQVTQCEIEDLDGFTIDALPEMVRRLDVIGATLEVVIR